MPEYCYSVGSHPNDHDEYGRFEFPNEQQLYGGNWELVATDLADDYFHNHDGWETRWPQEFRIWRDGELVGVFSVEMDMSPIFTAWETEPPATIGDGGPVL